MFKKIILFCLLSGLVYASSDYGVSVNTGRGGHIDLHRVALQKTFSNTIYSFDSFNIKGYHELAYGKFKGQDHSRSVISYTPVFVLDFDKLFFDSYKYYVDLAVGVSRISHTHIDSRRISTKFQFEDRISFGITRENWDLYLRYIHYSNASIKKPNDGIDIALLGLNYRF